LADGNRHRQFSCLAENSHAQARRSDTRCPARPGAGAHIPRQRSCRGRSSHRHRATVAASRPVAAHHRRL